MTSVLSRLHDQYGVHMCGEGGEYETFTIDGPLFFKRLSLASTQLVMHSDDAFAPVGYCRISSINVEEKALEKHPPLSHDQLTCFSQSLLPHIFDHKHLDALPKLQSQPLLDPEVATEKAPSHPHCKHLSDEETFSPFACVSGSGSWLAIRVSVSEGVIANGNHLQEVFQSK